MGLIASLLPQSYIDRVSYSFEQLFPRESICDLQDEKLDARLSDAIAAGASDLHLEYRDRSKEGCLRYRVAGDFAQRIDLNKNQAMVLMSQFYRVYGQATGVSVDDVRIGWLSSSFDHRLKDGIELRIVPAIGLSDPHGFDLICRILVKSEDNHKLTEINGERNHGVSRLSE